jgi:aminoglycoside 3-N-acetyltransferase
MTPATLQTRSSLAHDLRCLGLRRGDTVLLHSSLRALGWVCGGAPTVVRALLDVLTEDGTLAVPAQTPENRDPSRWWHAPVPSSWWPVIRAELPPFDPATTPCRFSGLIAETVRTWPGSVRSAHPQTSFAAVGRLARSLMGRHEITSELGEESPLRALEAADGYALLLGVGYDKCTAFHLAEYRLPGLRRRTNTCVLMTPQGRRWVSYEGADLDASSFADLGDAYETTTGSVGVGKVGAATGRLLRIRDAVRFAVDWLPAHRAACGSD